MPYIELLLNNQKLSVAGGQDIALITCSLVGTKSDRAFWLSLGGLQNAVHGYRYVEWIGRSIKNDDVLRITPLNMGVADQPVGSTIKPENRQNENAFNGGKDQKINTLRPKELCLEVVLPNATRLVASVEQEETLQAVVSWHIGNGASKLEVDSLTATEDGYTKGRRWLEVDLCSSDSVEIRVIG